MLDLDCSQPLFTDMNEKASEASAKHAEVGRGVCEEEKIFFFPVPTPNLVKSSVLRWYPVLSRFYPRVHRLSGFGSVRIVKNCDQGLENAALGLWPQAAFSRPRSQFFTIRTDPKPANNMFIFFL